LIKLQIPLFTKKIRGAANNMKMISDTFGKIPSKVQTKGANDISIAISDCSSDEDLSNYPLQKLEILEKRRPNTSNQTPGFTIEV
jgi:hypothetical protein